MEEYRRFNVISNTPSSTSLHKDAAIADASNIVAQLQHQLKNLRSENEQMVQHTSKLRIRINALEEEKVSSASNFNQENARLQAAVAKLQSQLERGEATRQTLEYDMAVTKKKANDIVRSNTHKEVTLAKANIDLADAKSSLELKCGEMENELILARQVAAENEKNIAILEDEKKQIQSEWVAAEAILRAKNDELANQNADFKFQNDRLEQNLEDAKTSLLKQEEELRKSLTDLQIATEREQHLRRDLEELASRAQILEESVEAERAAHLESKFNSEIIQLKQQEFNSQLTRERDVCDVLKKEAEDANKAVADLEKALKVERQTAKNAHLKLEKSVEVYSDVRKRLDEEIAEKTKLVEEMTGQLDDHQRNLDELKHELSKTRKRQVFLEETYGGNVREMELLLETFSLEPFPKEQAKTKSKKKLDRKNENATQALENMRKMLFAYQKKIGDLEHEVENRIAAEEQAQKDCGTFRDLALARERSLKQTQEELSQYSTDMEQIRTQQSEYEREAGKTCRDLEDVTRELQEQTYRCQQLEENVAAIQDRHATEIEIHVGFLRELHHVVCCASGDQNTLTRFTWSDLSVTVREGIDSLVNMYTRSKEKVNQLSSSCQELEKSIADLQQAHESSVDRLAERCREREDDASRQRKRLEQHYEALLAEMNARAQKTQALCDEAWERVRATDGVHDGLHAECSQLRGENGNLKQERKALACACAILLSVLYPAFRARDELAQQRALLDRINNDGEECKRKMRLLVDTLTEEMSKPGDTVVPSVAHKSFRMIHPLLRFRVAAVAVLAANRLKRLTQHANIFMFCCDDSALSNSRILAVAGNGSKRTPPKSKKGPAVKSRSDAAVDWLSDSEMIHGVRDATCGVVEAVSKNSGDASGYMSRAVVKTAKNAFLNILEATQPRFKTYTVPARNIIRERNSLCRLLAEGLDKVIYKAGLRDAVNLFSVEHSFSALQHHLLGFTERLHAAEVEKRKLRKHETRLLSEIEQLNNCKNELEGNRQELTQMKEKERQLISRSRFDGVCGELNAALNREKRAQKLLREQNEQLHELSSKLETECTDGVEKEVTLAQAVNSLTEVKMDLKRCEQTKRQLQKQVDRLEREKTKLQTNVNDAKNALKTAAGEKTSIAKYFASVEKTMQQHSTEQDVSNKLRIQAEELSDTAGPEMKAAQRAVESFVRAQSSAVARINGLEDQISSYRSHISDLKRELYAACNREAENGLDSELSHVPTRGPHTPMKKSRDNNFTSSPYDDSNDFRPLMGELIENGSEDRMNIQPRSHLHSSRARSARNLGQSFTSP